jgi:hypothetical protein
MHAGIFDGPAGTQIGTGGDPFRGVGVFKKPQGAGEEKSAAEALKKHLDGVVQNAMPLGFVRLVLLRRGFKVSPKNAFLFRQQDWLLYASPLLRMWEDAEDANYSVARYLWSLRGFPSLDKVEPFWFFYAPREELAKVMVGRPGRTLGTSALLDLALRLVTGKKARGYERLDERARRMRAAAELTYPILDVTADSTGVGFVSGSIKKPTSLHVLHALEGRFGNAARLPMTESYTQGVQSSATLDTYLTQV